MPTTPQRNQRGGGGKANTREREEEDEDEYTARPKRMVHMVYMGQMPSLKGMADILRARGTPNVELYTPDAQNLAELHKGRPQSGQVVHSLPGELLLLRFEVPPKVRRSQLRQPRGCTPEPRPSASVPLAASLQSA